MTDMKRYYIEVDVVIDREEEPWPTGNAVTEGVAQGLPKEYFDEGDEWHIAGMRTASHFADENALSRARDDLHAATLQLSISEEELERVNTLVDSRDAVISDLNAKLSKASAERDTALANQAPVREVHISVGILDDEAETLIDALESDINGLTYSAIEDAVGDIEHLSGAVSDTVRDNLPIMEERDMGWGNDDDMQILESYTETIDGALTGLKGKLDNIRTAR